MYVTVVYYVRIIVLTHFCPNLYVNTRHHVTGIQTILENLIQITVELVNNARSVYMVGKVIFLLKTPLLRLTL